MITLEEIVERMVKGKIQYGIPDEDNANDVEENKPKVIKKYIVPKFSIEESVAPGAKKKRETSFGKILLFIDMIKHIRSKTDCTIMPIPTTNKKYLEIWGSPKGVSRAIDLMIKVGLISSENEKYRYNARYQSENKSKVFRYYKENEDKFITYCKEKGISKAQVLNYNPGKKASNVPTIKEIAVKDVLISPELNLEKPIGVSEKEFQDFLLECLYQNYPELKTYQMLADEINKTYYSDYPEFRISFVPRIKWDKKRKRVTGIGIRATNSLCTVKREEREVLKKQYGFCLEKDVKSSVPRITWSLNHGTWLDEATDLYEMIYKEMGGGEAFTNESREAIKSLHMRAYFDDKDNEMTRNIWLRMNKDNVNKKEVDSVLLAYKAALKKVEGDLLYSSEIFLIESCVYMDTLYDLLKGGHLVWQVYDCFYSDGNEDIKEFEKYIQSCVERCFYNYYNNWFCLRKKSANE